MITSWLSYTGSVRGGTVVHDEMCRSIQLSYCSAAYSPLANYSPAYYWPEEEEEEEEVRLISRRRSVLLLYSHNSSLVLVLMVVVLLLLVTVVPICQHDCRR